MKNLLYCKSNYLNVLFFYETTKYDNPPNFQETATPTPPNIQDAGDFITAFCLMISNIFHYEINPTARVHNLI